MRRINALGWGVALSLVGLNGPARAADEPPKPRAEVPKGGDAPDLDIEAFIRRAHAEAENDPDLPEKKLRNFQDVTKGAERLDGLFTLHRKGEHLYAEIKPHQFDQPILAPMMVARGMAQAGTPMNFGDELVLTFKRVGDKVQLIRRNVHYKAPAGTALEKAVKQNYTDSILQALPIISINPAGQAVLIDLGEIFLNDFAQLGIGSVDRSRTNWHKIKAFPGNLEIEVETTYNRGFGRYAMMGDDGVADPRGITLVLHYSLVKMPEPGYRPRLADDRVGHFISALKDFGKDDPETNFVRQINRWRLEKADHAAKLSAPKKQIVWWIEDNVPEVYRPFVEDGILEWNKAFEKIGFRKAIDVRWQQDGLRDDFDPEDINYCTFRWITTPSTYAMSCLRADPITGEMIDGDVIFDASWIKHWKEEYALLTGNPPASHRDGDVASAPSFPLAMGRIISPIMAMKQGFGLPFPTPAQRRRAEAAGLQGALPDLVPSTWGPAQLALRKAHASGRFNGCQYAAGMRQEMALATLALADKDKDKDKDKDDEANLPDELLGQMIKEVVMHEVGHSLGLRHNFHASTMLSADQLNDPAITRVKGNVGSVMDYNPMNVAPKGQKQGDFITTTIGPYDYWAIEYAYKPIDGNEEAELKKIAERSPNPDLVYGTDDDFANNDPLVNAYDLGSDPMRFARDRISLATQLLKGLDEKAVKDGESWARARNAFAILLNQWGNASYLVAQHIGGQYVNRDHKATKDGRDPVTPVSGAKQREALKILAEQILSDKAFQFSPALLRKLTTERWYHWGDESMFGASPDYPIVEEILSIQRIAIDQGLAADVLTRLQNQETMADDGAEPLKMAEVFRALTDGIWTECPGDGKSEKVGCSTIRRNLQRAYVKKLATIVLGNNANPYQQAYSYVYFFNMADYPADARSLARLHLKEIRDRITKALESKDCQIDDTTRAHLDETRQRINKVLDAALESSEP